MLLRNDPFRELERLTQQMVGMTGTTARPAAMPMDAWCEDDEFVVELDLPGVEPSSIDLDVERGVLTVRADRGDPSGEHELLAAERPRGVFSRQLVLGESVDTEHVSASYDRGVLRLTLPVAEAAKPRKIEVQHGPRAEHKVLPA
ncbi:Hsp20/alpha crystallin family protein [Luteipulveratus halotolerans]|uniref:SHSP domain-containing protein n=1 Tax=Luteipulveratus halotolerans TaxID=1631356 RepID=A0A0L6CL22_9MICO|nr:Hsp20 family protein [Luteipulveratus halotolerans]KNX38481.1 hypothetical protein VV01_17160 [Luteipulveratus halotolerans]